MVQMLHPVNKILLIAFCILFSFVGYNTLVEHGIEKHFFGITAYTILISIIAVNVMIVYSMVETKKVRKMKDIKRRGEIVSAPVNPISRRNAINSYATVNKSTEYHNRNVGNGVAPIQRMKIEVCKCGCGRPISGNGSVPVQGAPVKMCNCGCGQLLPGSGSVPVQGAPIKMCNCGCGQSISRNGSVPVQKVPAATYTCKCNQQTTPKEQSGIKNFMLNPTTLLVVKSLIENFPKIIPTEQNKPTEQPEKGIRNGNDLFNFLAKLCVPASQQQNNTDVKQVIDMLRELARSKEKVSDNENTGIRVSGDETTTPKELEKPSVNNNVCNPSSPVSGNITIGPNVGNAGVNPIVNGIANMVGQGNPEITKILSGLGTMIFPNSPAVANISSTPSSVPSPASVNVAPTPATGHSVAIPATVSANPVKKAIVEKVD